MRGLPTNYRPGAEGPQPSGSLRALLRSGFGRMRFEPVLASITDVPAARVVPDERHAPVPGVVLDGVGQQVDQHLAQADPVGMDPDAERIEPRRPVVVGR